MFTIDIDVVVTGFPSNPREAPTDDVTMDVPTVPQRLSVAATCVLGKDVYPNGSRLVL